MRSVVVLPHPEGPSSAKKELRGISSEIPSTARTSANSFTTSTRRTSGGIALSLIGRAPGGRAARRRTRRAASPPCPSSPPDVSPRIPVLAVPTGSPVVQLLPELQVEEALGRDYPRQPADPVRHVEQRAPVGADDLDQEVE